jgi:RNA polymerase sigma factor (sigma-70 family)
VEASTLQAPATLARPRGLVATPLLRFRSDEQLVALFRGGHDEAFRAIHDRYHKRLFAYARQMLPARQDAEDALQDVFVRAYSGLRASDRDLALRAWLFRVAHNRCIDELRRPAPPPPEVLQLVRSSVQDPIAEVDTRESLRRLIADVRRLPDQQRSALLMRELGGMSYAELATSLGISLGAVKSVLVRARIALAQAAEARDTACTEIREELTGAHDRGVRPNANARRHMRDCAGCRSYRRDMRGLTRQLTGLTPAVGPLGVLAKLLGFSGGGGATAGGATAGGAAIAGGSGLIASGGGAALGAGHVATLIAAAVATAGGAVEIQGTISAPPHRAPSAHVATKHIRQSTTLGAQSISPANYAVGTSLPSTVVVAEAASSAAQKAQPLLGRQNVLKRKPHKSPPSGTGGGAMFGTTGSTPAATTGTGTGLPNEPGLTGSGGTTTGTGGTTGGSPSSSNSSGSTGTSPTGSGSTTSGSSGSSSTNGTTTNTTNNGSSSSSSTSGSGASSTNAPPGSSSSSTSPSSSPPPSGSTPMVPPK